MLDLAWSTFAMCYCPCKSATYTFHASGLTLLPSNLLDWHRIFTVNVGQDNGAMDCSGSSIFRTYHWCDEHVLFADRKTQLRELGYLIPMVNINSMESGSHLSFHLDFAPTWPGSSHYRLCAGDVQTFGQIRVLRYLWCYGKTEPKRLWWQEGSSPKQGPKLFKHFWGVEVYLYMIRFTDSFQVSQI